MAKGRKPNIHWFGSDLIGNGFLQNLMRLGAKNVLVGLYIPIDHLKAHLALTDPDSAKALGITEEQAVAMIEANRPELTLRSVDDNRTLYGTYDESTTCPPRCC